jgi:hypothetical protein
VYSRIWYFVIYFTTGCSDEYFVCIKCFSHLHGKAPVTKFVMISNLKFDLITKNLWNDKLRFRGRKVQRRIFECKRRTRHSAGETYITKSFRICVRNRILRER